MIVLVFQAVLALAAGAADLHLLALAVLFALRGLAAWQLLDDVTGLSSPWGLLMVIFLCWPWSFFFPLFHGLLLGLALDVAATAVRWVWRRRA